MTAAIFVFDVDGRVVVYRDLADAEGSLEAIDISDGEYPVAYTETGDVLEVNAQLDHGRLTATGRNGFEELRRRLKTWRHGPSHLADHPDAYAEEFLRSYD